MALQTMYPAKNNSPATALTEGITAESTSMTLYDASVLPAAPNICVIGNDDTAEIVIYTGISGNTVTGLGRGVNGTIAKAWPADAIVARNITAYDHEAFRANITALNNSKQNNLTFDTTPTADSANPVTSGGIKTALDTKQDTLTFDQTPTPSSTNPVESGGVKTALDTLDDAKVSKSGDTMTGNLVIEGASNTVGLEINVSGESGRGGLIRFIKGELTERVYVYHYKNNNTNYDLFKFPATTHSETSNGIYELLSTKNVVTTAQGGTGGTDSEWLTLPANSTVYTGTIRYRRIGKWVEVNLYQIKLVSDLTSTAGITLNTLPSDYKPDYTVSVSACNTSTGMGLLWIVSNGKLQFFKPAGTSSFPNTQNIYCSCMFFV